jgi:hypothetical protein
MDLKYSLSKPQVRAFGVPLTRNKQTIADWGAKVCLLRFLRPPRPIRGFVGRTRRGFEEKWSAPVWPPRAATVFRNTKSSIRPPRPPGMPQRGLGGPRAAGAAGHHGHKAVRWYHVLDGTVVEGGQTKVVPAPLAIIPVYTTRPGRVLRAGSNQAL